MTALVLIRHGPTAWTEAKRLQGHTDVPLSPGARAWIATWRLPADIAAMRLVASPLSRAAETARLLFGTEPALDPRLKKEAAFGDWEGAALPELRARLGATLAENEARGWHFQPPGGESPAMLRDRLLPFAAEVAAGAADTVAVCHNGVIRALYAHAVGWDLTGKPPEKLVDGCAHRFRLDPAGTPRLVRLNEPLAPAPFDPEAAA